MAAGTPVPIFLDGKKERQIGKSESCSLNSLPGNTTHHFCSHLIGQNSVTWPHQATEEAGKYGILKKFYLAMCQVKN